MLDFSNKKVGYKYRIKRIAWWTYEYCNQHIKEGESVEITLLDSVPDWCWHRQIMFWDGHKEKPSLKNWELIEPKEFKVWDKVKYNHPNARPAQLDWFGTVIEASVANRRYKIQRDNVKDFCWPISTEQDVYLLPYPISTDQATGNVFKLWDRVLYHGKWAVNTKRLIGKYFNIIELYPNWTSCRIKNDIWEIEYWIILANLSPVNSSQEIKTNIQNSIDKIEKSCYQPRCVETLKPFTPLLKTQMTNTDTNVRNLLRDRYFKKEWDKVLTLIETSETTMDELHMFNKAIKKITNTIEAYIEDIEREVRYNSKDNVSKKVTQLNDYLKANVNTTEMKTLMTAMWKTLLK